MSIITEDVTVVAKLIHDNFSSNSDYHAKQLHDGRYVKTKGKVTAFEIRKMLLNEQSIAIYQRNLNNTVKWICFDFDILKAVLETDKQIDAESHIVELVNYFTNFLQKLKVNFLREYSGNRGFHIWLIFEENISYHNAYQILRTLLDLSEIKIDENLVGLDLFPSGAQISGKYGKGVKIPLSKHTKSEAYSYLLDSDIRDFSSHRINQLTPELIKNQIAILQSAKKNTLVDLEQKFDIKEVQLSNEDFYYPIRKIFTSRKNLSANDLMEHWGKSGLFSKLSEMILNDNCSNECRKLLSGMLANLHNIEGQNIGRKLIIEILSGLSNYNSQITVKKLGETANYFFPSFYQISTSLNSLGIDSFGQQRVLEEAIPDFETFDEALFELNDADIDVTAISELRYLHYNDEVKSQRVISELLGRSNSIIKDLFHKGINTDNLEFYTHYRNENNKVRELVTLQAQERIYSSLVIKKIAPLFSTLISENSFGYQINENFKDGYIFKPWLYQWIKFLSGISQVIDDEANRDFYIVKTDISNFYNSVSHDHLERSLLTGSTESITNKLNGLSKDNFEIYKELVTSLVTISRWIMESRVGLPQGPAYARYLAEFYLIGVDAYMDQCIDDEKILFYHRYVDDMFFVCENKEHAELIYSKLKEKLDLYGLEINKSKSEISKISNFKGLFDKYRSQSKYIVDYHHKDFDLQSDYKKNYIMEKFAELAIKDEEADKSFVFSHLLNVKKADKYRISKIDEILKSGQGRGSLLSNVFSFILIDAHLHYKIIELPKLNSLQSEVLTSVILSLLNDKKIEPLTANSLLENVIPKLEFSEISYENFVYFELKHNIKTLKVEVPPKIVISCIVSTKVGERVYISDETFNSITPNLNKIEELGLLTNIIYKLAIESKESSKQIIEASGKIFFAKLADDLIQSLDYSSISELPDSKTVSVYMYQIICLYSSTDICAPELLSGIWELITKVFNSFDGDHYLSDIEENYWLRNHEFLKPTQINFNRIVSAIVEGSIASSDDKHQIFLKFHQSLIAYYYSQEKGEDIDIKNAMEELKEVNCFYKWIQDDNVTMFPNQKWFVENLINNDMIMLKLNKELLIRKPSQHFIEHCQESKDLSQNAVYGEKIVPFDISKLLSIKNVLSKQETNFVAVIHFITTILNKCDFKNDIIAPNIFMNSPLLTSTNYDLFTTELSNQEYLIVEDSYCNVKAAKNSAKKFISELFNLIEDSVNNEVSSSINFKDFYDKYLSDLELTKLVKVLRHLSFVMEGKDQSNIVVLDCAISTAFYKECCCDDSSDISLNVLGKFCRYYISVHSNNSNDMHALFIDNKTQLNNENAFAFITTIENSLLRTFELLPSAFSPLHLLIESFRTELEHILNSENLILNEFVKVNIRHDTLKETVKVGSNIYSYDDITLLNITSKTFDKLTDENEVFLKSSDICYGYENEQRVVLFVIPSWLESFYDSLEIRFKDFTNKKLIINHTLYNDEIVHLQDFECASRAIVVLAAHHNITEADAVQKLQVWLSNIPLAARQLFVTIIAGHEYMTTIDIRDFQQSFINKDQDVNSSSVLIKRLTDQNGTHRILHANSNQVRRNLDKYSIFDLQSVTKDITVYADISISGSQMERALDYYLNPTKFDEKEILENHYFRPSEGLTDHFRKILKNSAKLTFVFVLYTKNAQQKIKEFLLKDFPDLEVCFEGRDITNSCFLEDTINLTSKQKGYIQEFLSDKLKVEFLKQGALKIVGDQWRSLKFKIKNRDNINQINFVARYKSMPKGGLEILTAQIVSKNEDSSIFERVKEHTEFNK
tara:strand:- start:578 stop:5974 length:5397 start_codon:yes stop_codon:yes gene_type:complete